MPILAIHGVPLHCVYGASRTYHVPSKLILSILKLENGRVGMAKKNKNGSFDYGPMQINSIWLDKLAKYKITASQLQYDPCINVQVGTWILAKELAKSHTLWRGVGNYHSHSKRISDKYSYRVQDIFQKIAYALSH